MNPLPLIFGIHRGTTADGPGIRTTVFFKGCPLDCVWCHNPEAIEPWPELAFEPERCIGTGCSSCGPVCRLGMGEHGMAETPASAVCSACGGCAAVCAAGARRDIGRVYPLDELCGLLLKDLLFYRASQGGVTLSGGEPTMHHAYVAQLLLRLKAAGVHTVLQTCGVFDGDDFCNDLLPFLDLVQFDLKLIDPLLHRRYTGGDNSRILANLSLIAQWAPERLVVRVPLVPGITATEENLTAIARIIGELGIGAWELLPYNPGGIAKRRSLGRVVPEGLAESFMSREEEGRLREWFRGRMRDER